MPPPLSLPKPAQLAAEPGPTVAVSDHERLDGSGYYRGVGGAALDLPARILSTADVYDALAQDRPYRDALPLEQVLAILRQDAGPRLDSECVAALEELALAGKLGLDAPMRVDMTPSAVPAQDVAAD